MSMAVTLATGREERVRVGNIRDSLVAKPDSFSPLLAHLYGSMKNPYPQLFLHHFLRMNRLELNSDEYLRMHR